MKSFPRAQKHPKCLNKVTVCGCQCNGFFHNWNSSPPTYLN